VKRSLQVIAVIAALSNLSMNAFEYFGTVTIDPFWKSISWRALIFSLAIRALMEGYIRLKAESQVSTKRG
jgi:hypothetical protein